MNKDEWESLISAPGWPKLRQYLRDYRSQIAEGLAQGKFTGDKLTDAIIRCQQLKDLSEISLTDIQRFYGIDPQPTDEQQNEP